MMVYNTIMNTHGKGNIALAEAISHFAKKGWTIFLPMGDGNGAVDLIVSEDGIKFVRVQCKYTNELSGRTKRHPENVAYQVQLQTVTRPSGGGWAKRRYTTESFDLLFVAAPDANYIIPWQPFCDERRGVPGSLTLNESTELYRI